MKYQKIKEGGLLNLYCRILAGFILFTMIGCAQWLGFPAYYGATTYKHLTDLKPEIGMLYESFTTARLDTQQVNSIRLKLAQVYEYEKGKGADNQETTRQIEIIREMFTRHVEDRIHNGIWSAVHCENIRQNMDQAFDLAIQTERLKNKNE